MAKLLTVSLKGRSQIVAGLFSFFLAVILWILVTLSQTYSTQFTFPIKLSDVPQSIQVEGISTPELEVNLGGAGTDLIFENIRIKNDSLSVPWENFDENGHVYGLSLQMALRSMISPGINIQEVFPGNVYVSYNQKVSKKVPLMSRVEVNLRSSFQLESSPVLFPDSVEIIGSSIQLDTIHQWYTAEIETPKLGLGISELSIPIEDTISKVTVSPKEATLFIQPKRYTEKQIEIPVMVEGNPANTYVNLQANSIKVICLVPLENFKELEEASYVWKIPYDSLDTRIPYFIPDVSYLPDYVKVIRVEPYQMSYVVSRMQS